MAPSRSEIETDSWAFALAIYARPGVAEACLALQNEAGVDVMMLLMVTFAAVRYRILLTRDEIEALDDSCRPWREQIVWPLRTIRAGLKSGPLPAPSSETEQFRARVKAIELAAEKLQNQCLAECLPLRPGKDAKYKDAVRSEQLHAVLGDVVKLFADRRESKPGGTLSSSIDMIVEAAMQDAS
jgi:uncharacterized protein (TIGR02444 family)